MKTQSFSNKIVQNGGGYFIVNVIFFILLSAGFLYLIFTQNDSHGQIECVYKQKTGIECVTCGFTRSFRLYLKSDFASGQLLNSASIFYFFTCFYIGITRFLLVFYTLLFQSRKFSKWFIILDCVLCFILFLLSTFSIYLLN